eukprot:TRINITY_DN64964_c0_g2_i2.p1 TRINITY_DN64964_c0_g2~~TRINITY_DN64964_c0_g2_i2.p1  ORF type:complete len:171 (+),score=18.90 TRINITY_DN64964_c0_g2_i2:301-813(+)
MTRTMTNGPPREKPTVDCIRLNKVLSRFYKSEMQSGEELLPLVEAMRTLHHYFEWVECDIPLQEDEARHWRNAMDELHKPVHVEQQFIWCTKLQSTWPAHPPTFLLRKVKAKACGDIRVVLPGAVWRVNNKTPYELEWEKNLIFPEPVNLGIGNLPIDCHRIMRRGAHNP